jgi:ATP-dependent Clp protease protease subunit
MEFPGPGSSFNFRNQLQGRLLDARTLVVNEAITSAVAGRITEQLTVLDAEGPEPIQVIVSNAPGGDPEAGLSTYDLLRALVSPVTILGSGRIAGAGLIAFLGGAAEHRFALPHVRFRLEEPRDPSPSGPADDVAERADAVRDRRRRIVALVAGATGQSEAQVADDLEARRAFSAEEGAEYGLIDRVVENRSEVM